MHKTIIQQLIRGMVVAGVMAGGMMAADASAGAEVGAGAGTGARAVGVGRIEVNPADVEALYEAVGLSDLAAARAVLGSKSLEERTALVYADSFTGHSALFDIIVTAKLQFLELFIEYGIDVNLPCDRGRLPISLAAQCGCVGVMDVLHKRGADLDRVDSSNYPPLLLAFFNAQLASYSFLLENRCKFYVMGAQKTSRLWSDFYFVKDARIKHARIQSEACVADLDSTYDLIWKRHDEERDRRMRWSPLRRAWVGAVFRGVCDRIAPQAATGAPAEQAATAGRAKRTRTERYVKPSK